MTLGWWKKDRWLVNKGDAFNVKDILEAGGRVIYDVALLQGGSSIKQTSAQSLYHLGVAVWQWDSWSRVELSVRAKSKQGSDGGG